jgi:hypothetical protein
MGLYILDTWTNLALLGQKYFQLAQVNGGMSAALMALKYAGGLGAQAQRYNLIAHIFYPPSRPNFVG